MCVLLCILNRNEPWRCRLLLEFRLCAGSARAINYRLLYDRLVVLQLVSIDATTRVIRRGLDGGTP